MIDKLVALHKEYAERAKTLHDEWEARVVEILGEDSAIIVCNPFSGCGWLQLSVEQPSEGAEFDFEGSAKEKYYKHYIDGVEVVEVTHE